MEQIQSVTSYSARPDAGNYQASYKMPGGMVFKKRAEIGRAYQEGSVLTDRSDSAQETGVPIGKRQASIQGIKRLKMSAVNSEDIKRKGDAPLLFEQVVELAAEYGINEAMFSSVTYKGDIVGYVSEDNWMMLCSFNAFLNRFQKLYQMKHNQVEDILRVCDRDLHRWITSVKTGDACSGDEQGFLQISMLAALAVKSDQDVRAAQYKDLAHYKKYQMSYGEEVDFFNPLGCELEPFSKDQLAQPTSPITKRRKVAVPRPPVLTDGEVEASTSLGVAMNAPDPVNEVIVSTSEDDECGQHTQDNQIPPGFLQFEQHALDKQIPLRLLQFVEKYKTVKGARLALEQKLECASNTVVNDFIEADKHTGLNGIFFASCNDRQRCRDLKKILDSITQKMKQESRRSIGGEELLKMIWDHDTDIYRWLESVVNPNNASANVYTPCWINYHFSVLFDAIQNHW